MSDPECWIYIVWWYSKLVWKLLYWGTRCFQQQNGNLRQQKRRPGDQHWSPLEAKNSGIHKFDGTLRIKSGRITASLSQTITRCQFEKTRILQWHDTSEKRHDTSGPIFSYNSIAFYALQLVNCSLSGDWAWELTTCRTVKWTVTTHNCRTVKWTVRTHNLQDCQMNCLDSQLAGLSNNHHCRFLFTFRNSGKYPPPNWLAINSDGLKLIMK